MEQKVPVFKSDDIKNTMSKEQVDHFVNVKKSPKIISLASKEKIKRSRAKILIAVASALVLISLIIFLPALFKNLSVKSEADSLAKETEDYLSSLNNPNSEENEILDDESRPETVEEKILDFLYSDNFYVNEDESVKVLESLAKINIEGNDYATLIEALRYSYERLEHENNKATVLMLIAESYYALENRTKAHDFYIEAIKLNPSLGDLTSSTSYSSARLNMLIEFSGENYE